MRARGLHWEKISCKEARLAALNDMREYYHNIGKSLIYGEFNNYNPNMQRVKEILDTADKIADDYKHYKN